MAEKQKILQAIAHRCGKLVEEVFSSEYESNSEGEAERTQDYYIDNGNVISIRERVSFKKAIPYQRDGELEVLALLEVRTFNVF